MDGITTEDLLSATLLRESDTGSGWVDLSTVVERIAGSGQRLSPQVEVAVAVETLVEQGLVRRETCEVGERLRLTDEGRASAAETTDRLAERRVELVDGDGRRELTVEQAAAELDRSPVAVASESSEDGVYYDQQRVDRDGLVDREDERERFSELLGRVERTERGEAVRFVGPGGSGKTTLATALLEETSDAVDVVRARCRGAGNEPFQPVRDALDRLGADDLFDADEFQADDSEAYEAQQTGLFTDVTERLTPESGVRVLFFDDVDHADAASWSYLAFLCERLSDRPLVVVVSHRPGTLPEDAPIHPERDPETTRIEVTGLDRDATERLIEGVLGRRGVPDAFADAVYERTGGMALYVETTVETLVETNQLDPQLQWYPTDPADFDLPDAVRETIKRQAAMFERGVRDVLEWVAVARGFVPVSVLQSAADPSPDRVATILETVGWTGLLQRTSLDGETHVAFRNDAFAEALVEGLSPDERERRHETLARLLEGTGEDDATDHPRTADRAATVAYHYERGGDAGTAIEWYREAADRATDVYAHETAIDHLYRVIDVARKTGDTDALLSANERLAEVYTTVGEYEQADRHVQFVRERTDEDDARRRQRVARLAGRVYNARCEYDDAIETARAALDRTERASSERCRLLAVLAQAYEGQSDYERVKETTERHRELAVDLDRPGLEAEAIYRLGVVARHRGDYEQAHEHFEHSLDIYREVGDRQGEARSLNNLGIVAFRRDEYDRASQYHERSLEIKRAIDDRNGEANNLLNLGNVASVTGAYDRASEYYEGSLEIKRAIGDRRGEARNLNNLGVIAFKRGAYDRASEYYEESLSTYREIGDRRGETTSLNNLGLIAFRQGEYDRAREHYEGSLSLSREIGDRNGEAESLHNLGEVTARRGAYDRAREYYEGSLEIRQSIGDRHGETDSLNALGRLARRRGDRERAREYYEQSRESAAELGFPSREAMSLDGLAALARQGGDHERAGEYLGPAQELVAEAGDRFEVGQVRLESARLALARGDVASARERAEQARETFEDRGEVRWVGLSRHLLGRVAERTGDRAAALDHWESAVETFETIGSPGDSLRTLERLVEACQGRGDDERAREWFRQARTVCADAPAPVADEHGSWTDASGQAAEER